jgi:pimeloyl-ACP methyl ester carboxylesterase
MGSLYKSESGKQEILELYHRKLESLGIEYLERNLNTSFGNTHVIQVGEASKPPLIIVHGSNACAPISLETYPNLAKKYQVFAVDVPAQPNKSSEMRLSMKNEDYGKWMVELIEHLELKDVTLVGFSFGGLVLLKTLIYKEDNIREVYLAAPAFVVNGNPLRAMLNIFLPMKRYMKTKRERHIEKFLQVLFTEKDAFALEYLSKVFLNFEMDFSPIPLIRKEEAAKITTPITIFAAKEDLIFPGEKMLRRAKKIFPSLKEAILLDSSRHVQGRADNTRIENKILSKEQC